NDGFKGRFWAIQNELSVEVTDRLEAAVPCEFGKAELSLLRINSSRVEEIANGFFRWVIPSEISYKCEHHQTSEKANLRSYLWLQRAKGADLELLDRTEVVLE
ncbi:MAG: hypothetical protein KDD25_09035, partial [Bdellovibrionales bacterium]|nr:hypothetical protein [Bdellovibrionales bacterium]